MNFREECERILDDLGKPSAVLSTADVHDYHRIRELMEKTLQSHYEMVLKEASALQAPVVFVHMSDGWGSNVVERALPSSSGCRMVREKRRRAEFLLEGVILKYKDLHGRTHACMRMFPPREMIGKTGWHIFGSACDIPLVRHSCLTIIILHFYLQDGLHSKGNLRKQQAYHSLLFENPTDAMSDETSSGEHLEWVFGMRCILHVGQSGVKAAISPLMTKDINSDAHIVIASLRNSTDALHNFLDEFIGTRVVYDDSGPSLGERQLFWQTLGVAKERQLKLLLDVNPRWDESQQILRVRSTLRGTTDGVELIKDCLIQCLRWRNWSDSRMAGVSRTAQLYFVSRAVGVSYLVDLVMRSTESSNYKYYMGGYNKHGTPDVQKFLATAAVAVQPLDSFLLANLEDDRWLLWAEVQQKQIEDQCSHIASLPNSVWDAVADLVDGVNGFELRHLVVGAMHLGCAYVDHNAWELLRSSPLKLTQGSIPDNVDMLVRDGRLPGVPPCAQMRNVRLSSMVIRSQAIQALETWKDAACSIGLMEKGHGPGSVVRAMHKRLAPASLIDRSFVSFNLPLFKQHADSARIDELRRTWSSSLACPTPVRFTAQNLFCSELASGDAHIELHGQHHRSMACVSQHNAMWDELTPEQQADYFRRAARERDRRQRQAPRQCAALHSELQVLEARRREEVGVGVCNNLRSCRLPDSFIENFVSLFNQSRQYGARAAHVWNGNGRHFAPIMPDEFVQKQIGDKLVEFDSTLPKLVVPWWATHLCNLRDHFRNCALVKQWDEVVMCQFV